MTKEKHKKMNGHSEPPEFLKTLKKAVKEIKEKRKKTPQNNLLDRISANREISIIKEIIARTDPQVITRENTRESHRAVKLYRTPKGGYARKKA